MSDSAQLVAHELPRLRERFQCGENASQDELDRAAQLFEEHLEQLLPREKREPLALVDEQGKLLGTQAPRWLCHLLGLRHVSVHVLLRWSSLGLGSVFVLQVRSWNKSDSAGMLDISVGGHAVGAGVGVAEETAYREMAEELGVTRDDLVGHALQHMGGYEIRELRAGEHFFNVEWREVYTAEITAEGLGRLRFDDREVVGLYLCPVSEARSLLSQTRIPLAGGLRGSLPRCLEKIGARVRTAVT